MHITRMSPEYPIPTLDWVQEHVLLSAGELRGVRNILELMSSTERYTSTFRDPDNYEIIGVDRVALDNVFYILLLFLRSSWNDLEKPLSSLESLVTDFRCSKAIWLGDQRLPQLVAGISSLDKFNKDNRITLDRDYFEIVDKYVSEIELVLRDDGGGIPGTRIPGLR